MDREPTDGSTPALVDARLVDARLVELEVRYTEQQRLLQELSEVLYRQQQAVDALEAEVRQLRQRLAAEPASVVNDPDERPPHY